jgi:CheY-like chemotaxis protein
MPSGTETVLLAEDEAAVRTMIADGLRGLGYTVLEAANGDEALGVVCGYAGVVDVLLADVVMPHTGGCVLAERLRARYPALAVLLISGYLDCDTTQTMEQSLGAAFLQKPFTLATLARKVRHVIDRCSGTAAEEC